MTRVLTFVVALLVGSAPLAEEACRFGDISSETLAILQLPEEEREKALKERADFVNEGASRLSRKLICAKATAAEYIDYETAIDRAKVKSVDEEFKRLSVGEFSFFTDCGLDTNPFYMNTRIDGIYFTDAGLSTTTLEMIRRMGPLLLQKSPDGRTALETVEDKLVTARKHHGDTIQGVYARVSSEVRFVLSNLSEDYLKADGSPCW